MSARFALLALTFGLLVGMVIGHVIELRGYVLLLGGS